MEDITLKVIKAEKEYHQANNAEMLVVEYVFVATTDKGKEKILEKKKEAFPLSTTKKEMQEQLEKAKETFILDQEMFEKNKELDKIQAQADEVIDDLTDLEI